MSERRIRWGVLSTANIGLKRFIPGAAASRNGVVTAIASRDAARARDAATRLGIAHAYGSYEELLADPEIDAIYNPLPNSLHAEWTLATASAGKHVLCEKPLAIDAAQAQQMIDGCRERGVLLMEAFMYRFHPQHARVRALRDAGAIGELRAVRSAFTFQLEPFPPQNVRLRSELAGGALMDVGCYAVNAARMLFGEEPQWASAQWDHRAEFGVEVTLAGVLGFSDARMAAFDCGFRAWGQGSYAAVGTRGQIDVPNAFVPNGETTIVVSDGSGRRTETVPAVDQYQLEAEEFADAILNDRPLRIPPDDALGTLRAIEALRASARAGGVRTEIR
ncbi:deoxyfructose oxidoreductase [Vulcanimicrobium alpinum]|uniref:Deoxyfructose oxidoreductase n=1 Tax=Vulcanimicrobium alpinum TaxID=3016050 RepID=A0AAN1XZ45_UNVUL|nr:Gfo/Idh/MocA family oxidoreductase [Vulcanimicrobium alpinum]BDE08029.1 deoxyfructose oxidoreductase [Vulcanimicrobium alpinum]